MKHSIMNRLRFFAGAMGLANVLLLAVIATKMPVIYVIGSGSASAFIAYLILRELRFLRSAVDSTSATIGQFIRGSFDARVQNIATLDELGKLQHRINNLFDITDLAARSDDAAVDTGEDAEYVAKIRLTNLYRGLEKPPVEEPKASPLPPVINSLQAIQRKAEQLEESVRKASDKLSGTPSKTVAASASDAVKHMMLVSDTVDQLLGSIRDMSSQLDEASQMARQATYYTQSDSALTALNRASDQISQVTKQVQDIAERANLLALNASIEAARAGDAGQGFAMLADEVKVLAEQTGKATNDIARQVVMVQSSAGQAGKALADMGGLVSRMDQATVLMTAVMDKQRRASQEIGHAIAGAAAQAKQVATELSGERSNAVAEEVRATLHIASDMVEETATLQAEVRELHEAA